MDDFSKLLIDSKTEEKFNKLFRNALKKQRLNVDRRLSADYYNITDGRSVLGFDMSELKYIYAKTKSSEDINAYVKRITSDFLIHERMISFTNGQEFLRFTVMNPGDVRSNMLCEDFIGDLKKVVCYTADNLTARPLDKAYLQKWDVPREVLFSVADRNMCRMLRKAEFTEAQLAVSGGSSVRCLEFKAVGSDLIVALMMCSDFRDYISSILTPKFLAAAPSKDSLILFSEITNDILEHLGAAIVNEYVWAARPLTTDVLLYSAAGIEIAGHFSK